MTETKDFDKIYITLLTPESVDENYDDDWDDDDDDDDDDD